MNESAFTAKIKKKLPPELFWWKINDNYAGGVPDTFVEGDKSSLWIEFKYIKTLPKKDSTIIDLTHPQKFLSKLQQLWLLRRESRFQDTLVCVGSPEGAALFWANEWQKPLTTAEFRAKTKNISNAIIDIAQFCTRIPQQ